MSITNVNTNLKRISTAALKAELFMLKDNEESFMPLLP